MKLELTEIETNVLTIFIGLMLITFLIGECTESNNLTRAMSELSDISKRNAAQEKPEPD